MQLTDQISKCKVVTGNKAHDKLTDFIPSMDDSSGDKVESRYDVIIMPILCSLAAIPCCQAESMVELERRQEFSSNGLPALRDQTWGRRNSW
jgi:hypothetical protein